MNNRGQKIFCIYCRQESAVKVVKKYDGFTLVGEVKTCAFCGHEFSDDELKKVREKTPEWLDQETARRVCHRCRHYVVNPFIQKCGLSGKEVEALDTCSRFSPPPSPREDSPPPLSPPLIL